MTKYKVRDYSLIEWAFGPVEQIKQWLEIAQKNTNFHVIKMNDNAFGKRMTPEEVSELLKTSSNG
ncbi:hypothetical protein CL633_03375 [bacterium]|nr:hypothetical protein [bacterium]|tara:strand:+ start:7542 stop:7736 length:195 start_codon:yes stop_codon:yes gene_type:complete